MKTTIYQLKSDPNVGFSINEDTANKLDTKTKKAKKPKSLVSLWVDNYEGGEAYESDWDFEDDFNSHDEALEHIVKNYGEVEKTQVY